MQTVKNKLNNTQGASISVALLLFLVCAIVSSVVVVAGTTATGRLSDISESEERYYSVTSAAKLIQNQLDGKTAEIITAGDKSYLMTTDNTGKATLFEFTGSFNKSSIKTFPNYVACTISDPSSYLGDITMATDKTDLKPAAENVKITPRIVSNGRISFMIQNTEGERYAVKLTFDVNKKTIPIDLSTDEGSAEGTRTIYSFSLADTSVQ